MLTSEQKAALLRPEEYRRGALVVTGEIPMLPVKRWRGGWFGTAEALARPAEGTRLVVLEDEAPRWQIVLLPDGRTCRVGAYTLAEATRPTALAVA